MSIGRVIGIQLVVKIYVFRKYNYKCENMLKVIIVTLHANKNSKLLRSPEKKKIICRTILDCNALYKFYVIIYRRLERLPQNAWIVGSWIIFCFYFTLKDWSFH